MYFFIPEHGERKFVCTLCLKRFVLEETLKKHKLEHKRICDLCGKELSCDKSFERHMIIQHPSKVV